jgi:hypothetical protein
VSTKPDEPDTTSDGLPVPAQAHRVHTAIALMTSGASYTETRDTLREKFGIAKSSAERTIREAQREIAEDIRRQMPEMRELLIGDLIGIKDRAIRSDDGETAIKAIALIGKWAKYEAPIQVEVTPKPAPIDMSRLTTAQLEALAAIEGDDPKVS